MNIAILSPGNIAHVMAKTIRLMKENGEAVNAYAVAGRSEERSRAFAAQEGFEKAYATVDEMLSDPAVDLVYVASPHSCHAAHMKACIEHGKAVLCEKSFCANASQAEEVLEMAEKKRVPVTEAIWPRYMPSRQMIDDLIVSGAIGEVRCVTGCLAYPIDHIPRIREPELAGGALLDVGVYPITFASMVLGDQLISAHGTAVLMETGVDLQDSITLEYPNGVAALLSASAAGINDREGCIMGTKGCITVRNINNPELIRLFQGDDRVNPVKLLPVPQQLTGYEYEVRAAMKMIAEGRLECPEMPHAETIRVMRVMDDLRKDFGVRYPFE